jgi:hypothetical protein
MIVLIATATSPRTNGDGVYTRGSDRPLQNASSNSGLVPLLAEEHGSWVLSGVILILLPLLLAKRSQAPRLSRRKILPMRRSGGEAKPPTKNGKHLSSLHVNFHAPARSLRAGRFGDGSEKWDDV